ncbi:MAG: hypothetical protein SNJ74_11460 [Fimbriimonadaceae bacterium]
MSLIKLAWAALVADWPEYVLPGLARLALAVIGLYTACPFYFYTFPDEQQRFLESGTIIGPGAVQLAATITLVVGLGLMSLAVSSTRSVGDVGRAAAIIAAFAIYQVVTVGINGLPFCLFVVVPLYIMTIPPDQALPSAPPSPERRPEALR